MEIKSIDQVTKGRCAVERFRGQTVIYIPFEIGNYLDEETLKKDIGLFFPEEDFFVFTECSNIGGLGKFYVMEIPSIIERDENLGNQLVELVCSYTAK